MTPKILNVFCDVSIDSWEVQSYLGLFHFSFFSDLFLLCISQTFFITELCDYI